MLVYLLYRSISSCPNDAFVFCHCNAEDHHKERAATEAVAATKLNSSNNHRDSNAPKEHGSKNIAAQTFTFRELATATKNFRQECLIGEGGFGRVYKGRLEKSGQVIQRNYTDLQQLIEMTVVCGVVPLAMLN